MFIVIGIFFLVLRSSDAVGEECGDFCDKLIQDEVRKECGSQNGTKLYCRSFYYCCNADTATCCGAGHICSGATCISIAVLVVPIFAVFIVVFVTIAIIVKRTKSC
nr:uncharacterized protein LOC117690808 [Crassostrea gigas]